MEYVVKHELKERLRIHTDVEHMTYRQADMLEYYLSALPFVTKAKVYEATSDAVIYFTGDKKEAFRALTDFSFQDKAIAEAVPENSGRALNALYKEKIFFHVVKRICSQVLLPPPLRYIIAGIQTLGYLKKAVQSLAHGRLGVETLDAAAISISFLRGDIKTAGSVMFLLGLGELLEEWTHKKSLNDLAKSMSLNIGKVWKKTGGSEQLVDIGQVQEGDLVVVHMGHMISLDGVVSEGEAMVNQSTFTGEPMPVKKQEGSYVYAGTVVEEGELTIQVRKTAGSTRYEKIAAMIEDSERLKSSAVSRAASLADKFVPYTFAGTLLTYLFTRNATKALSVLMVDFSCALKLAMPLATLSAMREAGEHHITVKGGKFLEAVALSDTIVLDKTGTLTKAEASLYDIVVFDGGDPDEILRTAACLEEHYPHSIAKAVVRAAEEKGLSHEEMHSKVEYVVAHGVVSRVDGRRVTIGSYHFVFEDEHNIIPEDKQDLFENLPLEYSHLYMAVGGVLSAVFLIQDPLKADAAAVIGMLHELGFRNIVMMTGDSERTAGAIARKIGVDEYHAEVLPEDKAGFVEQRKASGRKVIMVGDGINDSPALSAADAGIAISEGAEIAREVADITISENDLYGLVTLKRIADGLQRRIDRNYRFVIGFNLCLIIFGVMGILPPSVSALLHNTSTIAISLNSMTDLLE